MKMNRIRAGWYANAEGTWAVISDGIGYVPVGERDGNGVSAGVTGGEWAPVRDPQGRLRDRQDGGEPIDWFSTKREALAYARANA